MHTIFISPKGFFMGPNFKAINRGGEEIQAH